MPDEALIDHAPPPRPAEPPRAESPYQDFSTPDLTEIGIAPPVAVNEPARPAVVQASTASPPQRIPNKAPRLGKGGSMVVPVQVTPGVRIGKFGKMGHPEDVVSVREKSRGR